MSGPLQTGEPARKSTPTVAAESVDDLARQS